MRKLDSKELRIGNLFNEKYSGQTIRVIGLSEDDSITFSGSFPNKWQAEPIPLTEDWLLKFGLEKQPDEEILYSIMLNNPLGFLFIEIAEYKYFQIGGGIDYTDQVEIHYVHQLQNLYFALTGEELTIKQPERS